MQLRLANKAAIVTGGSRGIGRAIALAFAAEGARVLITYGRDEAAARATVDAIGQRGGTAAALQADAASSDDATRTAAECIRQFGRLDILCISAGVYPTSRVENMPIEEWDLVHSVNVRGAFLAVKACIPQMKSQHAGRIVIISSVNGPRIGIPGYAHYSASKGALNGFIKTAAIELSAYQIGINAIEPGVILTEGMRDTLPPEAIAALSTEIPMKRFGDPEDIAHAAVYLAGEESRYMTGQSLTIDGGLILHAFPLAMLA